MGSEAEMTAVDQSPETSTIHPQEGKIVINVPDGVPINTVVSDVRTQSAIHCSAPATMHRTMTVSGDSAQMDDVTVIEPTVSPVDDLRKRLSGNERLFLFGTERVLQNLAEYSKVISSADFNEMTLDDLMIVKSRSDLYWRMRGTTQMSMLFGPLKRAGMVPESCMGTWTHEQVKMVEAIVENYENGDQSLYQEVRRKDPRSY